MTMQNMTVPLAGFDDERLARASLTYLAEPSDSRLGVFAETYGAAPTLAAIAEGTLPGPPARPGRVADALRRDLERWRVRLSELPTAEDLERLSQRGIRLVCPGDPEWPSRLDDLGAARPYALWLRGNADLRFSCARSVSIVGSRAATAYGSYVTCEIAASVAARGWTVISGAAYGVDGSAHSSVLGMGGTTIAVLACGVDEAYPPGHKDLLDAIVENGVVVSEWPPGRTPSRLRFLVRNRVIAALSAGTLVVEAGPRSGALNTARYARDLGRQLMAVPGPVTSEQSRGCHRIIRDWGGILVTDPDDVLDAMTSLGDQVPRSALDDALAGGAEDDLARSAEDDSAQDDDARHEGRSDPLAGGSLGGTLGSFLGGRGGGCGVSGGLRATRLGPVLSRDQLDLESSAVLDALPVRGALGTTGVAAKAGFPPVTTLRLLGELAAGGFVERSERGWRLRRT